MHLIVGDGISINVTSNRKRAVFHTYFACQVSVNAFLFKCLSIGVHTQLMQSDFLIAAFLTVQHSVVRNRQLFDWHIDYVKLS